jgi:hypothetical protein
MAVELDTQEVEELFQEDLPIPQDMLSIFLQ